MPEKKKKFVIIDGNAIIHRAWHALPPTMMTKDGQMTNAVYGFTMILLRAIKDLKPDFLVVTFDAPGKTFRHEEYKEYKGTRVKKEQELYDQIPIIKDVVKTFAIPIYEKSGFEADDLIGTLVQKTKNQKKEIQNIIVTGDADTFQLVDESTEVYAMRKGISDVFEYNKDVVIEKYGGLLPKQLIDYKGLCGDPSDNIPGVRGIGPKGAIHLLKEFHTLENLYKNIDSSKISERYRKLLKEHKADALLSKKLATIKTDVPIEFDLDETKVRPFDVNAIIPLFQKLQFKSLLTKLPISNVQQSTQDNNGKNQGDLFSKEKNNKNSRPKAVEEGGVRYEFINDQKKFQKFMNEFKKQKSFCFDVETTGFNPLEDKLLGMGIAWKEKNAYYIPSQPQWISELKPYFENATIKKIGQNIKFDMKSLLSEGVIVRGPLFDTMVASYLGNPGSRQHGLDAQVFTEFGYQMQPIEDLIGQKGKGQISMADVDVLRVAEYCCEDVDFTLRLVRPLTENLKKTKNLELFEKIEMPLIPTLIEMEKNGVKIDTRFLGDMSKLFEEKVRTLEKKIYAFSKTHFNIASPLQLKEVLFEKLKISSEGIARTKTGVSSAASELEKMKDAHPIIPLIIEYREFAKLLSTYINALPKLISKKTGRVHTSFNQTIAATGRLSSSDPNLQNIPIRTEYGQEIRKAFIAEKGYMILSADYSQIELRLAAIMAKEKTMIDAFLKNEDIHTRTAAELNNILLEQVTKEQRRAAKTVNFGILYGMGPFGLSEREGVSFKDAKEFIEKYFSIHTNIKKFIEKTKEEAKEHGYVQTLFGRRRYIPEIHSGVQQIRSSAERMAVNHPIQGTAADIMKLAMIEVYEKLPQISARSKMILQVHDELVFEVPKDEVTKVAKEIKRIMENVHTFKIPIRVDVECGESWGEMDVVK